MKKIMVLCLCVCFLGISCKNGIVYEGTWSVNDDYSQLNITLPNPPDEFKFLSRSWRFTNKNLPTLKFAPWGSSEAIVLNMTRQ